MKKGWVFDMAMTPKQEFIEKVACLLCKKCCRPKRVKERLEKELSDEEFDFEKDQKAARIIQEEA